MVEGAATANPTTHRSSSCSRTRRCTRNSSRRRDTGPLCERADSVPETMANTEANYGASRDGCKEQRNSWHGVDFMYHGAIKFDAVLPRVRGNAAGAR